MILDKIRLLNPGQIFSYFNFYSIKVEPEYVLFKNSEHLTIFAFRNTNGELQYLETIEFKILDKASLFLFLSENLEISALNKSLNNCVELKEEEYTSIELSKNVAIENLKTIYFNLKHTDYFKGTKLENINYEKNDTNCVVLFENKNPVDIITFEENSEVVFSEFGNNFGNNLKITKGKNLYITYNPILLLDSKKNISTAITKYYVNYFDLINIIKLSETKNIVIPTQKLYSNIYKMRILFFFWNIQNHNISITFNHSPNKYFLEIIFNCEKNINSKILILNLISEFENRLKVFFESFENQITEILEKNDYIDYKIEEFDNCLIGKLILKKNYNLIKFVNDKLIEDINKSSNYSFK